MMGRNNTDEGESSDKACKSDASGQPLRKARYLWQIKGKYHMKSSENEASKLFIGDENTDRKCSPTEMLENCASKCLKESPPTIQEENNNGAHTQEANNRALSESKVYETTEIEERIKKRHMRFCETQLRRWQARQVAWCYFDNTVNSVMEESGFLPLLQDTEALLGNFRKRRTQRKRLENRAVMMAIHSHGLQRTEVGGSVLPSVSGDHSIGEEVNSDHSQSEVIFDQCQNVIKNSIENITNSGSESLTEDSKDDVYITKGQDSSSVSDSDISCKSVDSENMALQSVHLSLPNKLVSVEDESVSIMEHTDFMDKAVAVAIQKKGLSAFTMEHD